MRDKLIELLENSPYLDVLGGLSYWEEAADHLIANGVTIQKWIPVTERLPRGMNDEGISEIRIVYTRDGEVTTGWVERGRMDNWWLVVGDNDYHTEHDGSYVTHWMPLPEAPKEP